MIGLLIEFKLLADILSEEFFDISKPLSIHRETFSFVFIETPGRASNSMPANSTHITK